MRGTVLPLSELGPGDLDAWRALADGALEPNPYFEPEYLLPAVRELAAGDVRLLVASEGGTWTGCLPVVGNRWRGLRLPCLSTWRHQHCALGSPLVARDAAEPALDALLDAAFASPRVAFLGLEWIGDDGRLAEALRRVLAGRRPRPVEHERFERAALRARPEPTYADEALTGVRRKNLRRLRRRLEEQAGGPVHAVDRSADRAAADAFLALEARGWKGRHGTALAASFPGAVFFRELCSGFRRLGRLQILALEAGGATVAMQVNVVAAGTVFTLWMAYDEAFARFSPGVLLELDALARFHGLASFAGADSCTDRWDRHARRLWPDRRSLVSLVVPAPSLPGRTARPVVRGLLAGARARRRWRRFSRARRAGGRRTAPAAPPPPRRPPREPSTRSSPRS